MQKTFLIILFAVAGMMMFSPELYALEAGDPAGDFELVSLSGEKVKLSDHSGKVVVLNFWATWCPPCRKEMPDFDLLDKELKKTNDAVLLAVNMTDGKRDTAEKVRSFIGDNKFSMKVLLDAEGKAAKQFDIRWLPTTVVIDSKGIVRWQVFGETTKEAVLKAVKETK